jgi:hypothetical protein
MSSLRVPGIFSLNANGAVWADAKSVFLPLRPLPRNVTQIAQLALPRICWIAVAVLAAEFPCGYSWAQHASDNPVASAEDAYGLTLGLETIGLYLTSSGDSTHKLPETYASTGCTSTNRDRCPIE